MGGGKRSEQDDPDSDGVLQIICKRTRKHLHDVAAQYKDQYEIDLAVALTKHLKGHLKHGVMMLFEPSENYYAYKLHAAFHGLNRTPELRNKFGSGEGPNLFKGGLGREGASEDVDGAFFRQVLSVHLDGEAAVHDVWRLVVYDSRRYISPCARWTLWS